MEQKWNATNLIIFDFSYNVLMIVIVCDLFATFFYQEKIIEILSIVSWIHYTHATFLPNAIIYRIDKEITVLFVSKLNRQLFGILY